MRGWKLDGEADVKAVVAVKIEESLPWAVGTGTSPFPCDSKTVLGLVCDATAGSRGGLVLAVFADERKTREKPDGDGQPGGGNRCAPSVKTR